MHVMLDIKDKLLYINAVGLRHICTPQKSSFVYAMH